MRRLVFLVFLLGCRQEPGLSRAPATDAARPAASSADAATPAVPITWTSRTIAGCELRFADAPDRGPTDLAWQACGCSWLSVKACRELTTTSIGQQTLYAVGARAAGATMLFVRSAGLPDATERYVLGPPDGPPRLVVTARCRAPAAPGMMAIGVDGAALELHGSAGETTLLAGPFSNDPSWQAPAASYGPAEFGEVIFDAPPAVADRSIRAVDARLRVFRSTPSTGAFTTWRVGPQFRSSLEHARARGDTTLFVTASIPEVIGAQIGSASPAPWYSPPAGGGVSAPAIDDSTVYLLVGTGRDKNNAYASIDVFSTPLPTSAPAPAPTLRRVGASGLRTMDAPIAGAGHVAWRAWLDPDHTVVDVLDVATARRVRFTPPPARRVGRLVWVDDAELGVVVVDAANRSMTAPTWTWRVRLDALPPAP